jgi:hypothetical protein
MISGSPPDANPQSLRIIFLQEQPGQREAGRVFLLKSGESRHLAANAFGALPGVW